MAILKIFEQQWLFEKRLLLLVAMILLGTLAGFARPNSDGKYQSFYQNEAEQYFRALSKITGRADWQLKGWGSGEYLTRVPKIKAGAVVDLDSGEVFWSMNLKDKIAPASLSKVVTVMTAIDVADLDQELLVSKQAASQIPTKLGLKEGERLKLGEAISAAILTSANDATEAISDSLGNEIGDGTATFMELVNKKLNSIGALDSHFETSTGLDSENHYSTVYDLAILAHEAKKYDFIREVAALDYKRLPPDGNHRLLDLPNWNALLGTYPGVDGLKIGYTEAAGYVTMVTAERGGKNLVAIVIGAKSLEDREIAAATLLNYGFEKSGIAGYPIASLDLVSRFEDWRRQLSQGGP